MRSPRLKLLLWAVLCLLAITACLVGVDYLVGEDPEPAAGYRKVTLAWDPLESTCRHASLSIL